MKKSLIYSAIGFFSCFTFLNAFCQGNTPQTISMAAGTGNGTAFGSQGLIGSDGAGVNFYVHWDATYLYLGWNGGNTNYSSDMYYASIDTDPNGTNGSTNAIEGVSFNTAGGTRRPDYYVVYENNSSFYGSPITFGNAFEIYSVSGGNWVFNSRTNGNDNTSSRVNFSNTTAEVRMRIAWSALGFTPGSSTPLGITMWNNNGAGNYMWARFPTDNPAGGSTPKTLTHSFIFYNTSSGVNPSTARVVENNTFTTGSISGTQNLGLTISGTVSLSADATLNSNLNLLSGAALNTNGNILTVKTITGTGTLSGSAASSLVVNDASGTLNFTSGSRILKNLTLNSGTSATLGTTLDITAGATPGTVIVNSGATLTTGGNLTLKSDANGTARVGTSLGTITGNVNYERYINADVVGRKWHLLSGQPVTTAQTIRQSWQENGSGASNLGTWITSPGGGNGFDGSSISSSLLRYNQVTPAWAGVSATNSGSLSDEQGYMLFIRGDRTDLPSNATTHATVLRATGTLKQGTQTSLSILATGGYTLVGNPFASPIDFETFFGTTNLQQSYYIWDPAYAGNYGVGGYCLVTRSGGGSPSRTPTTGSDATLRYIHSGQAFFLKAVGSTALLVLDENSKTASTPVVNPIVHPKGDQQIYVEMRTVNSTGTLLNDAVRVFFNQANSSGIADDVEKISNFGENLSVVNQSKNFIVENRPLVGKSDTVFLRIGNMATRNYRFRVRAIDFIQDNVTAWLEDAFTGKSTPISLSGDQSDIDFSVTSDPASAKPNRFRIVFRAPAKIVVNTGLVISDEKDQGAVTVFPNPVTNRIFSLKFVNMEKGLFQARILGLDGQAVFTRRFEHAGGDGVQNFRMENIPSGNYRLEITRPDGSRRMQALAVDAGY